MEILNVHEHVKTTKYTQPKIYGNHVSLVVDRIYKETMIPFINSVFPSAKILDVDLKTLTTYANYKISGDDQHDFSVILGEGGIFIECLDQSFKRTLEKNIQSEYERTQFIPSLQTISEVNYHEIYIEKLRQGFDLPENLCIFKFINYYITMSESETSAFDSMPNFYNLEPETRRFVSKNASEKVRKLSKHYKEYLGEYELKLSHVLNYVHNDVAYLDNMFMYYINTNIVSDFDFNVKHKELVVYTKYGTFAISYRKAQPKVVFSTLFLPELRETIEFVVEKVYMDNSFVYANFEYFNSLEERKTFHDFLLLNGCRLPYTETFFDIPYLEKKKSFFNF